MRKYIIGVVAWVLALAGGTPAWGQVWGQFGGAETIAPGGHQGGAYLLMSENATGLLGQLRLSFYRDIDFGFSGGFTRQDYGGGNRTTLRMGADLKIRVADALGRFPAKVALGGVLGVETGDEYSILTVGPTLVVSRAFAVGQGGSMTPFGRIGLAITTIDAGPLDDSDVSLPLHLGLEGRLNPTLGIVGELQLHLMDSINDDVGFALGVNLPF